MVQIAIADGSRRVGVAWMAEGEFGCSAKMKLAFQMRLARTHLFFGSKEMELSQGAR